MKIEQVDREAAGAYLRSDDCPATVKMTIKPQALIEAFARHRIQALEAAAKIARDAGGHPVGGGDGGTYVIGTALDAYHAIRASLVTEQ